MYLGANTALVVVAHKGTHTYLEGALMSMNVLLIQQIGAQKEGFAST